MPPLRVGLNALIRTGSMQELLGMPTSRPEELAGHDDAQLLDMADQLQQQRRARSEWPIITPFTSRYVR